MCVCVHVHGFVSGRVIVFCDNASVSCAQKEVYGI